ncbi:hypothetical protein LCGC14_0414480 [marine sediment metagenome]|uniref:Phage tail collar domain-containing protein n=1 Tax=marine sediment metagenome TaxID=412755 RepID=A0A0F9W1V5_9ZZZZ
MVDFNRDASVGADDRIDIVTPIGVMLMWMTDVAPVGWKICDGTAISRTTFADLFTLLDTTYGIGDGSTTFNLPDLRGRFARGRDAGAAVDPDAGARTDRGDGTTGDVVGTKQAEDFKAHTHVIQQDLNGSPGVLPDSIAANQGTSAFVANKALATGGNETRPTNINVNYIIRAS